METLSAGYMIASHKQVARPKPLQRMVHSFLQTDDVNKKHEHEHILNFWRGEVKSESPSVLRIVLRIFWTFRSSGFSVKIDPQTLADPKLDICFRAFIRYKESAYKATIKPL